MKPYERLQSSAASVEQSFGGFDVTDGAAEGHLCKFCIYACDCTDAGDCGGCSICHEVGQCDCDDAMKGGR